MHGSQYSKEISYGQVVTKNNDFLVMFMCRLSVQDTLQKLHHMLTEEKRDIRFASYNAVEVRRECVCV